VTIVGLKTDQDNSRVFAEIFDGGKAFEIDLKLWYETTTLGGGFVFFKKPEKFNECMAATISEKTKGKL